MQKIPLTKRLDANLGYACNNNCLFCYFRRRKGNRCNLSTQDAKDLLAIIHRLRIDTLELTGGEVTLRDDFFEIVSFAKNVLGFKKISVITNGTRFCERGFAQKAVSCGIDDVLVSVHGPDAALHDSLVDRKGAFKEAMQAASNVLSLGASCRSNTVISAANYKVVGDIAKTLLGAGITRVNYIYFSPLDDALDTDPRLWVSYSETAPFVSRMVGDYRESFQMISLKVVPFCFLKGLEDYITDFYQNIYDPYEWDFYNRVRIRRGVLLRNAAALAGLVCFMDIARMLDIGLRKSLYEGIMHVESFRECVKTKECSKCRFDFICPGLWKAYARRFGIDELKAVPGEKTRSLEGFLQKRFGGA